MASVSQLRRIHEYTVDKGVNGAPGVARIVSVNPLIRFVSAGNHPVIWQGGKWFDDGGQPLSEDKVPEDYKNHVRNHPPVTGNENGQPDLLVNCEYCDAIAIPASTYARHLADVHIKLPKNQPATPADLPAADYQTNTDGTVKTDRSGRPKRKVGRPKRAA